MSAPKSTGRKPSVVRRPSDQRRVCRSCGMVFEKKDAIGTYPTEYGDVKGLLRDDQDGVLRHDCRQGARYTERKRGE